MVQNCNHNVNPAAPNKWWYLNVNEPVSQLAVRQLIFAVHYYIVLFEEHLPNFTNSVTKKLN